MLLQLTTLCPPSVAHFRHGDGNQNDQAHQKLLITSRHVHDDKAVPQQGQKEASQQTPHGAAATAADIRTAEHDRSDDVHLDANRGQRLRGVEPGTEDQARNAGAEARHGIKRQLPAMAVHPAAGQGLLVAAHETGVGPEFRKTHQEHAEGKKLRVIWVDAHADINTNELTTSGNIHGMPVACLLGNGPEELTGISDRKPAIEVDNIRQVGLRSVDPGEKRVLVDKGSLDRKSVV